MTAQALAAAGLIWRVATSAPILRSMEHRVDETEESGSAPPAEADDMRRVRLAWESACIEEGLTSARAGRIVPFEAVKAWVDSWDTPHELPKPRSGA